MRLHVTTVAVPERCNTTEILIIRRSIQICQILVGQEALAHVGEMGHEGVRGGATQVCMHDHEVLHPKPNRLAIAECVHRNHHKEHTKQQKITKAIVDNGGGSFCILLCSF
jgi:hypothetical protein